MKVVAWLLLILTGTLLGSIYGILHDQITFTLSPEFYTKVRFGQLHIEGLHPRLGAVKVGVENTLLYSFLISSLLATAGLVHGEISKFVRYTLQSFCIAIAIAFLFGITGWLIAESFTGVDFDNFKLPENINEREQFKSVQLIHNFSYMGGIIGMLIGTVWQFFKRKKDTQFFGRAQEDI